MSNVYLHIRLQIALTSSGDRLLYFYLGLLVALPVAMFFDLSRLLFAVLILLPNLYLFRVIFKDLFLIQNHFYGVMGVPEFHRHLAKQLFLALLLLPQLVILAIAVNPESILIEIGTSVLGMAAAVLFALPLYQTRFEILRIFVFFPTFIGLKLAFNLILQ